MVNFLTKNSTEVKLSEEQKQSLEGKITRQELILALKAMKPGKAPGMDGLPREIYIVLFNRVGNILLDAINQGFEIGKLHDSALRGLITLIPKKGKDCRLVRNMRPITLLNTDYKLIEKVLANRMRVVLDSLIENDQKVF